MKSSSFRGSFVTLALFATAIVVNGCVADAGAMDDDRSSLDDSEADGVAEVSQGMSASLNVAAGRPVVAIGSVSGNPSLITNSVFAPEGTVWNNATYAPVVNFTSPSSALRVDLVASMPIDKIVIQADCNDYYLVEGANDGTPWSPMVQFGTAICSGLRTRTPAVLSPPVYAKYLRVTPLGGDHQYSVSEIQAFTSNTLPAPAGYWDFNSLVNGALPDMSGNGAPGQLKGGVFLSTGLFGSAGEFHGRAPGEDPNGNDAVEISSNNRPQLHFQGQVSAAAWVYPTADSQFRNIVNQWYAMDSFGLSVVDGKFMFSVAVPDPSEPWGKHYLVETPATLNAWSHVVGVYDGSAIKIYVNGALRASAAASGALQQSTRPIVIGNHPSPNAFKGKIDEVRLYQQALTDAQVAFLASSSP